jgi:transcriptional regulator with XRE-family HTH domain
MSLELGTNWHVELKDRLKRLRELTGLTQQQIVDRSQGSLRREEMTKLENGRNLATTLRIQRGLALGYGVSRELMEAFIGDEVSPEELAPKVPPAPDSTPSNLKLVPRPSPLFGDLPQWTSLLQEARKMEPGLSLSIWQKVAKMPPVEGLGVTADQVVEIGRAIDKIFRRDPKVYAEAMKQIPPVPPLPSHAKGKPPKKHSQH